MVACAAAGGEVKIKNVIPRHLESISAKLREMGVVIIEGEDSVVVKSSGKLRRVNVKTMPYPGFPTDMQPQVATALCLANGTSVITEGIYDNRFKYTNELRKMGAQIQVDGRTAVIEGVERLTARRWPPATCARARRWSSPASAPRARPMWRTSTTSSAGYENFVGKLRSLGADIGLVSEPDEPGSVKSASAG